MKNRLTLGPLGALFTLVFILSGFSAQAQLDIEGDAENGKSIFNAQCASCHQLDRKAIGPALSDITERRDLEWLKDWIINNQKLRASGDEEAVAIFEEYNGSLMPNFPNLSEQDVLDILVYTQEGGKPAAGDEKEAGTETVAQAPEEDNTSLLIILAVVLALLIVLLVRVKNTLKQLKGEPATSLVEDANVITRTAIRNPRVLTLVTIVVAVVLLQQLYLALLGVGVTQDYQPPQPIKFSHALHAGDNQIDCNYCHYGARKGKHSNIPSAQLCMNCHMQIQEGPEHGTEEITKIYAAVGWDPETYSYIDDYETKPIKWVRIHNLPDLAYFNHAQHVTAGQVACQTCHGPVEEMEEVYQYSPLTMGWCIDCHRETEVKTKGNDYYTEMHEKLKKKYGDEAKITVEMIGGLECGKCHY